MTTETGMRSSQVDVLVIGAGPSGLMAAQALARLGVNVKIVDRRDPGALYGNADGLQPGTLEMWQSYGMLDKFFPKSALLHALIGYEQGKDGGLVRSTPSQNIVVDCRYPFSSTASIETIEETLRTPMEEAGVRLEQPIVPVSIDINLSLASSGQEESYPVKVVLNHLVPGQGGSSSTNENGVSPETEVVRAKYVIGADGAYSWVRRHLGVQMEGDQTEHVWGVADVEIDTDFPDCRFKCIVQSSKGAMILIPREGEKIRFYAQLSPEDSIKTPDGRLDKSAFSPEIVRAKVLERIKEVLRPYKVEFTRVHWSTIFSVAQKVATKFYIQDRIFIVGDACHTHSPKAGQGANASMGDSHNLAWKIAYVVRGWAGRSLLDTYEEERRTFAQELIDFDKKVSDSLEHGVAQDYKSMIHEKNMFTSGIGTQYRSRLTDSRGNKHALHLKAGVRLPPGPLIRLGDWQPMDLQDLAPSNGLFKLIVFPEDILTTKAPLINFADALGKSMSAELRVERLTLHTIASSRKELVHWRDVPPLLQDWKRVFVSDEIGTEGVYRRFGVGPMGMAVLVRPDGYISLLTEISDVGAQQVATFLGAL